jgi:hypothetical protein
MKCCFSLPLTPYPFHLSISNLYLAKGGAMKERPIADRIQPHTGYVALTDMMSAAGLILPITFLVIGGISALITGVDQSTGFLGMGAIAALIGFPLAWWRVQHIKETLAMGVDVDGTVTFVKRGQRSTGNTRVKWHYQYEGKSYEGEAYVGTSAEVRVPEKGRKIHLWVHPNKPQWSVWRDLYSTALALGKG